MFYEVIYEDGFHSVANYGSDEEAISAVKAHHERATKGMKSIASDGNSPPATRVVKVLVYETHPDDYNVDQMLSGDEVTAQVKEYIKDSPVVFVPDLVERLRGLTHPMVDSEPHDSNYKMSEARELDWAT